MYRSWYFLEIVLIKGLSYGYKGKEYAIEVVIIVKKLPLNNLKDIKNNLGKA